MAEHVQWFLSAVMLMTCVSMLASNYNLTRSLHAEPSTQEHHHESGRKLSAATGSSNFRFLNGESNLISAANNTEIALSASNRLLIQAAQIQNQESQGLAVLILQQTVAQLVTELSAVKADRKSDWASFNATIAAQQLVLTNSASDLVSIKSMLVLQTQVLGNISSNSSHTDVMLGHIESELQAMNATLGKRPTTWETIWATGAYGDVTLSKDAFNRKFHEGGGIAMRKCKCNGYGANTHDMEVYFRRKTNPADWDAYEGLLVTWQGDRGFHTDFDIYSGLFDLKHDINPWASCNGDDPGVGFPRDCSPAGGRGSYVCWTSIGLKRDNSYAYQDRGGYIWQVPSHPL